MEHFFLMFQYSCNNTVDEIGRKFGTMGLLNWHRDKNCSQHAKERAEEGELSVRELERGVLTNA